MLKLQALAKEALKGLGEQLTFNIKEVEVKPSKTGNVGYRVKTDQGKVVTFWASTMDEVIEEVNEARGEYAVKAAVTITEDGSLIAPGKGSNGFWS